MGFLDNLVKTLTKEIGRFVAFVFFIFTAGMLYGLFISSLEPVLLFIPPLAGLVAYYDERIGILLFVVLLLLFL